MEKALEREYFNNDALRRKVILLSVPVAVVSSLFFGVESNRVGENLLAIIDFFMAFLFIYAGWKAFKDPESIFPGRMITVASLAFFFYFFISGAISGYGVLWSLLVPLIAFFLTGFSSGAVISTGYLTACVAIDFFDLKFQGLMINNPREFLLRFYGVYCLITITAGAYEFHKDKMERDLLGLLQNSKVDHDYIERSDLRYRALFEGSGQGIVVADAYNMDIIEVNPAACEIFGYEKGEMDLKNIKYLHPPDKLEEIFEFFEKNAKSQRGMVPQLPCRKKDGTTFYCDLFTTLVNFEEKPYVVGFFADVTAKVAFERELIAARKKADSASEAKSYFLANVSHASLTVGVYDFDGAGLF